LSLEWTSSAEVVSRQTDVFLEYGRHVVLPRIDLSDSEQIAATFEPVPGSLQMPTIEIRGGTGESTSEWMRVCSHMVNDWQWCELRVTAATDPIPLGEVFAAEFRDTWVHTAAPQEQRVAWTFVAPSGIRHEILATYRGGFRWSVEFVPDEIGPWAYSWSQAFTEKPYMSETGWFDVLGGDLSNLTKQLGLLAEELRRNKPREESQELIESMVRFCRLERAALQQQTPETFASAEGVELRRLLNEVRALLDEPVPDPIPLLPNRPTAW
jgi:hypothetical protein